MPGKHPKNDPKFNFLRQKRRTALPIQVYWNGHEGKEGQGTDQAEIERTQSKQIGKEKMPNTKVIGRVWEERRKTGY